MHRFVTNPAALERKIQRLEKQVGQLRAENLGLRASRDAALRIATWGSVTRAPISSSMDEKTRDVIDAGPRRSK